MNEKLSISLFFTAVTILMVIVLGLLNEVSFLLITMRVFLFGLLMGVIGYLLGYLMTMWEKENNISTSGKRGEDNLSQNLDIKEDSHVNVNQVFGEKTIIAKVDNMEIQVQPKKAAAAIRKLLSEEEN